VGKGYESIEYGVLSIGRGNNPTQRGTGDRMMAEAIISRWRVTATGVGNSEVGFSAIGRRNLEPAAEG
jgi:hypothetical protein